MLVLTLLVFITLAMKGGSYVYYFENYVDKESLAKLISPVLNGFSNAGINFLVKTLFPQAWVYLMQAELFV